jgi:gas vesicle protein GvpN
MALHLADLLGRPIMLLFGDDEFKTSDLIGNQTGYTRKKVVDNFIHSVVKMEDELRHNWVDSRLTLACREGFTLVYDEFNRSRPEVNNVLLSALEEKLLVLPPSNNRAEYIRVNPHFRGIFTSNPEEYCGVHATQDALLDRLITINMPEPDELTQREIAVQKTGIDRQSAQVIVQLVREFRDRTHAEKSSGLRSCLMLAKICQEHGIIATPENAEFRDMAGDILLSRTKYPILEATQELWNVFNGMITDGVVESDVKVASEVPELEAIDLYEDDEPDPAAEPADPSVPASRIIPPNAPINLDQATWSALEAAPSEAPTFEEKSPEAKFSEDEVPANSPDVGQAATADDSYRVPYEREVFDYLQQSPQARPSEIEAALGISRYQTVNALRALTEKRAFKGMISTGRSDRPAVSQQFGKWGEQ